MPFGLRNAPATFQRLIDKFRAFLKNVFALSYLDDFIILLETFDQHISDLQTVFERLSLFKLHSNREKCHFACDRVKYLGYWITENGIEVDLEKVFAIQRIPVPTNVEEVQSFLQTCSWFRRYVPNFVNIARLLSNLIEKNVPRIWGPEHNYALGAVLTQGKGPEEHVIEYASRLLMPAERKYSTTKREALAVVWALEKLRETSSGKKWIFLVEDTSTKWVELFALKEATSVNCAKTLVEEIFLRYGLPRRLISDNGSQFISVIMQQTCNFLGIKQELIPVYHTQANPFERKNRDLKPRLAILVRDEHDTWEEKLPMIRFALNTAKCETTNHTAACLQLGRELRTTDDVTHDLRALIDNDKFVAEINISQAICSFNRRD
ncbi:Retrovirus-related Pol polyprotein from transposon 17.6 [Araneus ventricosus]|uniref:Retrovirus-related Pol polyprotein from transposon 17.6 n=1 Tax=Araneus ventricosus TaxID=182803 RepID=A0A4Y2C8D0_ARAVE|nr:Retrovirus-related Pol polyprotein from transposon 17.6 [Araneus ventricosus]